MAPFSLLLLIISLFFVSTSSLPTVSISETSNNTLICALIPSANRQSFLNCTSFSSGIQIPNTSLNASISSIAAGNGFLCILRSPPSSSLHCSRFSGNGTVSRFKRIYPGPALNELESGNSHVCGTIVGNGVSRLECWQWEGFNSTVRRNLSGIAVGEEFVCGVLEFGKIECFGNNRDIIDNTPDGNFSVVAAGFHHACAISVDGRLHCWGQTVGEKPEGEFTSLALGNNRSCAVRDDEKVVCWGENEFNLPEGLQETDFISIEAKGRVFCGILTYNFSLFCWGNEIFESNAMVFEKVLPGPCRTDCPCKFLPDSGTYCSQGYICRPCEREVASGNPPESPENSNGGDEKRVAFLVVGIVGTASLAIVICFFLFRYCKGRGCRVHDSGRLEQTGVSPEPGLTARPAHETHDPVQAPSLEKRLSQMVSMGNLEEFSLQELLQATGNFSLEHKIGSGSFGSVYRATLQDGREVAIKRAELSTSSSYAGNTKRQEDKEDAFISELAFLSRVNHKNLVRLLGFCEEGNENVLVYELMTNGTLHEHLHKLQSSPLMSWPARFQVALDAARGIEYLHTYAVPSIIHRDIKSSNILLDAMWSAKVSDFGLSLLGPEDEESHISLRAAGTVGYMDPEYYRLQQLTTKSDVYSFGVVLLELLSGYRAIHKNENGVPRNVVDFVVPYIVADEIHRVLDPKVPAPTPFEIEAVTYVGFLALDCVSLEGRDRPSMTEIVNRLERALAACGAPPLLSRSTTGSSS
ncbi:hypothetical protein HHK36_004543 [Tetracentron sinense]|uniref:non-specific serine/threonine protein kinase n=1 Tax=Tetracentron sinense TaxID=13715 RepID=A0A834ZQT6_TETSI|nr:hypothetical protein HHK36_004543 [Tetracentron sinense]